MQPLDNLRGYIKHSRTQLLLRLIPDNGRSKVLPLFIAMRGFSNTFLVHLPSWHDELCVCKEKTNKVTLNVSKCSTFGENFKFGNCWGDMKKNLINGRSLESV